MEPLQLGVIAGLTPPDVEVVLYDDHVAAIPYDEPIDLAAIWVTWIGFESLDPHNLRAMRKAPNLTI